MYVYSISFPSLCSALCWDVWQAVIHPSREIELIKLINKSSKSKQTVGIHMQECQQSKITLSNDMRSGHGRAAKRWTKYGCLYQQNVDVQSSWSRALGKTPDNHITSIYWASHQHSGQKHVPLGPWWAKISFQASMKVMWLSVIMMVLILSKGATKVRLTAPEMPPANRRWYEAFGGTMESLQIRNLESSGCKWTMIYIAACLLLKKESQSRRASNFPSDLSLADSDRHTQSLIGEKAHNQFSSLQKWKTEVYLYSVWACQSALSIQSYTTFWWLSCTTVYISELHSKTKSSSTIGRLSDNRLLYRSASSMTKAATC